MHAVALNIRAEVGPDGAGRCFLGIGGADELTVIGDAVFLLQHHRHNRAAAHEFGQLPIERARFVYFVKLAGILLAHVQHLDAEDLITSFFDPGNDISDMAPGDAFGFDHGVCAF